MSNSNWRSALILAALFPWAAHAGDLTVTVTGAAADTGLIRIGLFDNADAFPEGDWRDGRDVAPEKGQVTVTFPDLPPGDYALAAYHDANGNDSFDTDWLGLPKEAYGFSGDGGLVPPDFADAAVTVGAEDTATTIRLGGW